MIQPTRKYTYVRIDIMYSGLLNGRSGFLYCWNWKCNNALHAFVFVLLSVLRVLVWAMKHDVPRELQSRKLRTDRQIISFCLQPQVVALELIYMDNNDIFCFVTFENFLLERLSHAYGRGLLHFISRCYLMGSGDESSLRLVSNNC